MIKPLLLLSISLLLSAHSYACNYDPSPIPFCAYADLEETGLIASGKIIEKIDRGYLIKLHTVYRGEETRREIKVFEQAEWNCSGIAINYKIETLGEVGQVILFIASPVSIAYKIEPWYETEEYYNVYYDISGRVQLSSPLVKNGETFEGFFSQGVETVEEEKIIQELRACGVDNLLAEPRILCEDLPLKIYPNPAKDQVFLENLDASYEEILLYDMRGKIVHRLDSPHIHEVISTQEYSSGLYILVLRSRYATLRKKLVLTD